MIRVALSLPDGSERPERTEKRALRRMPPSARVHGSAPAAPPSPLETEQRTPLLPKRSELKLSETTNKGENWKSNSSGTLWAQYPWGQPPLLPALLSKPPYGQRCARSAWGFQAPVPLAKATLFLSWFLLTLLGFSA